MVHVSKKKNNTLYLNRTYFLNAKHACWKSNFSNLEIISTFSMEHALSLKNKSKVTCNYISLVEFYQPNTKCKYTYVFIKENPGVKFGLQLTTASCLDSRKRFEFGHTMYVPGWTKLWNHVKAIRTRYISLNIRFTKFKTLSMKRGRWPPDL